MTARPIKNYMSVLTQAIAPDQTLIEADKVLRENHIRHLPVIQQGKLVGIISQTDLHLVERLSGIDPALLPVGRAMTPLPYAVSPNEPLDAVVGTMSHEHYGCAIVVSDDEVVGIFTQTDAVGVLADELARH